MTGIIIVGAGQAGGRIALQLRSGGFTGRIRLIGSEVHQPYERPPLSKEVMLGERDHSDTLLAPSDHYAASGIELLLGTTVVSIDRARKQVTLGNGEVAAYDKLVLATGARPRILPLAPPDGDRILTLRTLEDSQAIGARLKVGAKIAVLGAGIIGLEVAAVARQRGCEVTVIEAADEALTRIMPSELGAMFVALHRRNGVRFLMRTHLTGLAKTDQTLRLQLSDGSVLEADVLVIGIGVQPNDQLAADAGLAVKNGIVTDRDGLTSDEDILAAGDAACSWSSFADAHVNDESWANAEAQAARVVARLTGNLPPVEEVPWFWTDQYDLRFQAAGASSGADRIVWREAANGKGRMALYMSGCTVIGGACVNASREFKKLKTLIGTRL